MVERFIPDTIRDLAPRPLRIRHDMPELPKTEDQLRYEALPNNVIKYLDITKSSRNPLIGDDSRAVLRSRAAETFQAFNDDEKKELIGYLVWRQENVIPSKIKP